MRKLKLSLTVLISVVVTSCFDSNAIYFDIKEQTVLSCNKKGINRLYISNDSIAEDYILLWADSLKNAPNHIRLDQVDSNYTISKGWNKVLINAAIFKLKPFSSYTIERVQPDVSAYKISIMTGKNGNIMKAVPDKCKN